MISLTKVRMDNKKEAEEYGEDIDITEFKIMRNHNRYHKDTWNKKNIEEEFNIEEFKKLDKKINYLIREFTQKVRIKNYLINNKKYTDLLEELSVLIIYYRTYSLTEIIDKFVRTWKVLFYAEYKKIKEKSFYETNIIFNKKEYKGIDTSNILDMLYSNYEEYYYHIGSSQIHEARTLYGDGKNKILEVLYLNQESHRLFKLILELMDWSMKTIQPSHIISQNYRKDNIFIKYQNKFEDKDIIISSKNIRKKYMQLIPFESQFFQIRNPFHSGYQNDSIKIIEDKDIYIELPKHTDEKLPIFQLRNNFIEKHSIHLFSFSKEEDYENYINGTTRFKYSNKLFEIIEINYEFEYSYVTNKFIKNPEEDMKIDINLFKKRLYKINTTSEYMESNMQIGIDMLDFNL